MMDEPLTLWSSFVTITSASNFSTHLTNAADARAWSPFLF
jgi:hypothetical protein